MTRTGMEDSTGIKSRRVDKQSTKFFAPSSKSQDNEQIRGKVQHKKFKLPIKTTDKGVRQGRKSSPSRTPTLRNLYSMSPNPCARGYSCTPHDHYSGLSPAPEARPPSGRKTAGMHFPASGVRNIKDYFSGSFFGARQGRTCCTQGRPTTFSRSPSPENEPARGVAAHVATGVCRDQVRRFSDVEYNTTTTTSLYQEVPRSGDNFRPVSRADYRRKCQTPDVVSTVHGPAYSSARHIEADPKTPVGSPHCWSNVTDPTDMYKRCQYLEAEVEYLRDREAELREKVCQAQSENAALSTEMNRAKEGWKEAMTAKRKAEEAFENQTETITRLRTAYSRKLEEVKKLQVQLEEDKQKWMQSMQKLQDEVENGEKIKNVKNSDSIDDDLDSDISLNEFFENYSGPSSSTSGSQEGTVSSSRNNSPGTSPRTLNDLRSENKRLLEENKKLKADNQHMQQTKQAYDRRQRMESLKQEGNKSFQSGNYAEALKSYAEAVDYAQDDARMQAMLHSNKAATLINMERHLEAIVSSCCAISIDCSYLRGYQRRAGAYEALGDISAALQDLHVVINSGCSTSSVYREAQAKIGELQRKYKRAQTADPYRVLGLRASATTAEVKSQFRKLALQFHPDKMNNQEGGAEVFKIISHANSILSDESKRRRFDSVRVDSSTSRFDQRKRY